VHRQSNKKLHGVVAAGIQKQIEITVDQDRAAAGVFEKGWLKKNPTFIIILLAEKRASNSISSY
jgi:hypothetical protein